MKMNRCQVEISTTLYHDETYCEVLLNHEKFQPAYAGQYPISQEDCDKAHTTGTLDIDLGDRVVQAEGLNNPGNTRVTEYLDGANIIQHKCFDDGKYSLRS